MYGVVCVKLAYSYLGDREHIFVTHLIIIIKSEKSTFPIVVIFFRGCVHAVGFIYILWKLGFVFFITVQSYDVRK